MSKFKENAVMVALAGLAVLVLVACGANGQGNAAAPDEAAPASAGDAATVEGQSSEQATEQIEVEDNERLSELLAETEGMDVEERRAYLIDIAEQEEESQLQWYGSMGIDDLEPLAAEFEELTGVVLNVYRATTDTVRQRVLEEAAAGFAGADLVQVDAKELTILSDAGLLAEFSTPTAENLHPDAVHGDWYASQFSIDLTSWNTNAFPEGEVPENYLEVFEQPNLVFEVRKYELFQLVVEEYLMGEHGMTEDEAVQLIQDSVKNSLGGVKGTATAVNLMAAGQFDMIFGATSQTTERIKREGAPVEYQPAIEPVLARPNGVAIPRNTQSPASALLWSDFMLSRDGQQILADAGRTPTSNLVDGGLPEDTLMVMYDFSLWDDPEKVAYWEGRYEEVLRDMPVVSE